MDINDVNNPEEDLYNYSSRVGNNKNTAAAPVTNPRRRKKKRQPKNSVAQARKKLNFKFIFSAIDKPFLLLVLVLLIFGIIMMFSASFAWGINKENNGFFYVKKQLISAGLGLAAMVIVSFVDYHFYQNTKVVFIIFVITYLITLYTAFFGTEQEGTGARRWLYIGPLNLQPSELLKVAFILIFAYIMAVNFPRFDDWKYCIVPFGIIMGAVALVLALQRHMSAVMLIGIIGVSMMFVSGMPAKTFWKFIGCCAGAAMLLLLVKIISGGSGFSYISERIQSWKDPTSDISGSTYQTYESLLAIGSGGWTGLGFGESKQKYLYLPEAQNDFVYSIICEELGFVGGVVVLFLFVIFTLRGFYIASHAKDRFGMLVTTGITIQIGSQALFNIMVASNAFPNTGISLPFFSYGGTALLIQLAEMGIILNISRQCSMKK